MGLALETFRQGNPADFQMVLPLGEGGFDAGVNVFEVGPLAAGQVNGTSRDELQTGRTGEGTCAAFHKQQMVVMNVAAIEIALIA